MLFLKSILTKNHFSISINKETRYSLYFDFFFNILKCGVTGGFGSYILGLNRKTYELAGVDTEGNTPGSTKEPGLGWITGFLFVTCFVGLLALVPLRKVKLFSYVLIFRFSSCRDLLIACLV